MFVLELKNVSKSFGELKLFQNLSIELEPGKIYSLMGANGSGKTTLFNILTGFIKADSGKILLNKHEINLLSPQKINRLGISRTFQDLRLINNLSVRENILLVLDKKMFHYSTKEEIIISESIMGKISLLNYSESMGGDLSYGQQKLLTLGCCLANSPKLLLLDEPISGIDKINQEKIKNIVIDLKNEGKTILQIEHNEEYIESTSDIIFFIDKSGIKKM
jgi:branched-chain amino acid transport system ATP-binding protein